MLRILDIEQVIKSLLQKIAEQGSKKYYKLKNEIPNGNDFVFLQMKVYKKILTSKNYDFKRSGKDREFILEKINRI